MYFELFDSNYCMILGFLSKYVKIFRKCYNKPRGDFFEFPGTYAGGEEGKKTVQKYNIDYFGYAANLEVKFKLNFDEERGSKIKKKVKIPKKIG